MGSDTGQFDIETISLNPMESVFATDSDGVVSANDRFLDIAQSWRETVVGYEYDRFEGIVADRFAAFVAGYERAVADESGDMDSETVEPDSYLRDWIQKLRDAFPGVAVIPDLTEAARGVEIRGKASLHRSSGPSSATL